MVKYIPSRGDIVWLDFDPQSGREIKKIWPALVISPQIYNEKAGLALFMPITSKVKGYPFEELISVKDISGAVLCDQLRSLDWRVRRARLVGSLSPDTLRRVLAKIRLLIG